MTDKHVTVRALSPDDLDGIVALDQQFSGTPRQDFFSKRLKAAEQQPTTFISLTAQVDGHLAGFVSCQLLEGEYGTTEPVAVLDAIGVDREYQRRGVGQRLFEQLKQQVRTLGGSALHSVVPWNQPDLLRFFSDAGFELSDRQVLELPTDSLSECGSDSSDLSRDRVTLRSLKTEDLDDIVTIDRRITEQNRRVYLTRALAQALNESGIRVSLVAEADDPIKDNLAGLSGFIMARVECGEFGQTASEAVIDTIGVDPAFRDQQIGQALVSQLVTNLKGLRVDSVRTEVPWNNRNLSGFLHQCGFRPAQRLALTCRL